MLKKIVLAVSIFLLSFGSANAYSDQTTHPALTQEIIEFYNLSFPDKKISAEEAEWIIQGSITEDTPPRWVNHFYDPIRKVGWTGDNTGNLSPSLISSVASIFLTEEDPLPSTVWVHSGLFQEKNKLYGGNRTWEKGMEYYAYGDKKEAYITLGHILHLLEDLNVPDHTRDDTHIHEFEAIVKDGGSPYEDFSARWNRANIKGLKISESLKDVRPPKLASIDDYLIASAEYSNKYFFSKDTINSPIYVLPKIIREDGNFGYGYDENKKEIPIVGIDFIKDEKGNFNKLFTILNKEEYFPILSAYFSRLSKSAVLNGAGVVNLFMEKGEEAIINKDFPVRLVKLNTDYIFPTISLAGEYFKWKERFGSFTANVGNAIDGATDYLISFFSDTAPEDVILGTNKEAPLSEESLPIKEENRIDENPIIEKRIEPPDENNPEISLLYEQINDLWRQLALIKALFEKQQYENTEIPLLAQLSTSFNTDQSENPSNPSISGSAAGQTNSDETTSIKHLVLSEIQVSGETSGDEFIEIYNPTNQEVDISSWSVQYLSGKASSTDSVSKKNFEDGNSVKPKKFFLVARAMNSSSTDGYTGNITADLSHRSFNLSGLADGGTVFLVNDQEKISGPTDENIVDKVAYGNGEMLQPEANPAPLPESNSSIERRAGNESACSTEENTEFLGNGCDAGNNSSDLMIRTEPRPQNSLSLQEPRSAPRIANFSASYDFAPQIVFGWDESTDAEGSTSSMRYKIKYEDSTVFYDDALSFNFPIRELNRNYDFEFMAEDRDGLVSITTTTVRAKNFLDDFHFFKNPNGEGAFLDYTTTSSYKFWDSEDTSDGPVWKIIVPFLNHEPDLEDTLVSNNHFATQGDIVSVGYTACNGYGQGGPLVIAYNPSACQTLGPMSISWGGGGASRFILPASIPLREPTSTDFVTLAFYNFSGGGSGVQNFSLTAFDRTKYFFEENVPDHDAPTIPSGIISSLNDSYLTLALNWEPSLNNGYGTTINYEISFSTSTESAVTDWQAITKPQFSIPVVFADHYYFKIRALDSFGFFSPVAVYDWNFPEGYSPLPMQLKHERILGAWGSSVFQRFYMTNTATIDGIALWVKSLDGQYSGAEYFIGIHEDNDGSVGELIATANPSGVGKWDGDVEIWSTFDPAVTLAGDKYYWIQGGDMPTPRNRPGFYGSDEGFYFTLRKVP